MAITPKLIGSLTFDSSDTLDLQFSSTELETAADHPNKMILRGVLLRLDEPSTKAPNGSDGHKILVTSEVAKSRLNTLIGMGLNYTSNLDGHAQRRKVGVIEKAWIKGKDLCIQGIIWKHDFPEAKTDLKQGDLGMSMEIGQVHVEDVDAKIWNLTDFYFLGATILYKDKAAYYRTQAIAAKADERSPIMAIKKGVAKKKATVNSSGDAINAQQVAEIAAAAAVEAINKTVGPMMTRYSKTLSAQTEILASFAGRLENIELNNGIVVDAKGKEDEEEDDEEAAVAAGKEEEDDDEEEASAVNAKKHEDADEDEDGDEDGDEDDDEMESAVDKGDLEDMKDGLSDDADGDDEPGHMSKGAKNKGSKTTSEDKVGNNISKGVTGAAVVALRKHVKKLSSMVQAAQEENAKLKKQLNRYSKQVTAASSDINRRSLPPELVGLLAKQSLNVDDLRASGTKMTADEFDGVLSANNIKLDVTKRIEFKNILCKAGLMEEGRVDRSR